MRRRMIATVLSLFVMLGVFAAEASAQGRGRGRGNAGFHSRAVVVDREFDRRDRWRVVIGNDRVFFGNDNRGRPPGWDRGRKVGWGNCDVPPGLAKKGGCRTTFFGRTTRQPRVIVVQPHRVQREPSIWVRIFGR